MDRGRPNERQGFYHTPNIEKLAARGMRFSNAYAPASVCTPARKSIQIGKSLAQMSELSECPAQQFFCRCIVFSLSGGFAYKLISFGRLVA